MLLVIDITPTLYDTSGDADKDSKSQIYYPFLLFFSFRWVVHKC